jgi:hypothetical protein
MKYFDQCYIEKQQINSYQGARDYMRASIKINKVTIAKA